MKNVTFHISFEATNESDFAFASSIVNALKVQSGVNVHEAKAPATPAPEAKAPATPAPEAKAPETKAPATPAPEAKVVAIATPEAKVVAIATPEAKVVVTAAPEAKEAANVKYTCEDARKAMASKLANHRTALVDKLRSLGAKNISTLPQDKYTEFIDFCNSLTD